MASMVVWTHPTEQVQVEWHQDGSAPARWSLSWHERSGMRTRYYADEANAIRAGKRRARQLANQREREALATTATRTITWNTGALYTSEGQVITAAFNFTTRRVIFNDHSRSISGVFRAELPAAFTAQSPEWQLTNWVHREYLVNAYDFDGSGDADRLRRVENMGASTMVNHPNRSKRRAPRNRVTLANSGGTLDARVVSAHPDWTDDQIAEVTARAAIELIRETRFLRPGDVITVTEIER